MPPHMLPHGLPVDVQPQPFTPEPPPPHVFGAAHVLGHVTAWPQLLTAGPHAFPAHVVASASGVQQLVPTHTRPAVHCCAQPTDWPQLLVTETPPHRPLQA